MRNSAARFSAVQLLGTLFLGALLVTGCSGTVGDRSAAASATAKRFAAAIRGRDFDGGCALLAPETRRELEDSAGKPCPQALEEEDPPPLGREAGVAVYGEHAEIRGDQDTVFLARFGGSWRVVAAGCKRRPDAPYDCAIKGA